jgi:homoserine dehydrogenase
LAAVATEFGRREVSIAELRQDGLVGEDARIVVVTHRATDAALSETVAALSELDVVEDVTSVLRLEGTSE